MNKIPIVIASVLKPVNDSRNFEKIAFSLAETNKYEINIIGFKSKNNSNVPNINFHGIYEFKRNSIQRLSAGSRLAGKIKEIHPKIVICTAPEILKVCVNLKRKMGFKLIYDIQENYFENIKHNKVYLRPIRQPLAGFTRQQEASLIKHVDSVWLAEKCYATELRFLPANVIIIENKYNGPVLANTSERKKPIRMLYTGTIGFNYGIEDAISYVQKLNAIRSTFTLDILGYSPDHKYFKELISTYQSRDVRFLRKNNEPIPHEEILKALSTCDYAILPYRIDNVTKNRIPTKMYECLALEVPMIIRPNPAWIDITAVSKAAHYTDFEDPTDAEVEELVNTKYYTKHLEIDPFWSKEGDKVVASIKSLA